MADDKLVHAHLDRLVRFFLDEEPLLPSVPSRPATEVDDLSGWVVKPRGEMGGEDVVIWDDWAVRFGLDVRLVGADQCVRPVTNRVVPDWERRFRYASSG